MKQTIGAGSAAALFFIVALGGCATTNPGPLPLVDLTGHQCAAAPDFARAVLLSYNSKKDNVTTTEINGDAPCFQDAKGASLYAVYALPASDAPYTVNVASQPTSLTMFAPRVFLYGADSSVKRDFSGQRIAFRGNTLSIIFRNHDDERYLVVASDPAVVGQTDSRIQDSTQVSGSMAGAFYFEYHSGSEAITQYVFAHNGSITVTLAPLPAK